MFCVLTDSSPNETYPAALLSVHGSRNFDLLNKVSVDKAKSKKQNT
ncbi:hypothetical protein yrohd0001_29290 [Yersinia rohdei ATCC 43380]|nr:hypothetical protein yrohd0001_29290 [Yersinia rohdei ATCC 43380]